jgi:hypothetical protein
MDFGTDVETDQSRIVDGDRPSDDEGVFLPGYREVHCDRSALQQRPVGQPNRGGCHQHLEIINRQVLPGDFQIQHSVLCIHFENLIGAAYVDRRVADFYRCILNLAGVFLQTMRGCVSKLNRSGRGRRAFSEF